jgi:hypothetical protein
MGFLSMMFGQKRDLSEPERIMEAEKFLSEVELLIASDLKAAMKSIGKKAMDLGNLFRQEGPLGERFTDLVLRSIFLKRAEAHRYGVQITYGDLPSVMAINGEEKNTLGEIIHALKSEEKDIVFMEYPTFYGPPGSTPQYGLLEIELLYEFCIDSNNLLFFVDEVNFMARRSFLLSALPALNQDIEMEKLTGMLLDYSGNQENLEFQDGIITTYSFEVPKLCSRPM